MERPRHVEAHASGEPGTCDGALRDECAPRDQTLTGIHAHLAEALPAGHRQRERRRRYDAFDERAVDAHRAGSAAYGDERQVVLAIADRGLEVDVLRLHHPSLAIARHGPAQEPGEITVPLRARRTAEHRRVQRDAVPLDGRDLALAGRGCVTRLDAVE